jgi:5'-nucleotidase
MIREIVKVSTRPLDLAKARVLISNDDGVHAPGLKLLERVMRPIVREVWVVVPETEQSAAGHSLTLRQPLRIRRVSRRRYAVDGTPTDCVLLAVHHVMKDCLPDIVLSGINRGGNLGEDVTYSGTVAAAMEATLLGFPAIALSLMTEDRHAPRWKTAERWTADVVGRLAAAPWPSNVMINVNFPDVAARAVTGVEITRQGRRKIGGELVQGTDPRGEVYFWIGSQRVEPGSRRGTDLEAVRRGAVSVTPLSLDLTHTPTLKPLRAVFR